MNWNFGDKRNLFLNLESKLGIHHVVLKTPKSSPGKHTLTVVEMQQMPDIKKSEFKENFSCLKWTVYNGRRKKCVNFNTDTGKVNFVVYRYRNSSYLKNTEDDLKLTKKQSLSPKRLSIELH